MPSYAFFQSAEVADLADDVRALFEELSQALPLTERALSGECQPPLDVVEYDAGVEVTLDVPGVSLEAVRIVFRAGVLLVVGEKAPRTVDGPRAFHLVEREFGRFARGIRLTGAFNVRQANAALQDGQLTIRLPKMEDRRGQAFHIPIAAGSVAP